MDSRLTVIVGRPGTGKTRIAQATARQADRAGVPVLVSDPFRDPRWAARPPGAVWSDPSDCCRVALACDQTGRPLTVRCLVVLDEAGAGGRPWLIESARLARSYRHHGHAVLLLVHRWADVLPVARSAACRVIALPQAASSAEDLAKEYGLAELAEAGSLDLGEALVAEVSGRQSVRRVRLW